MKPLALLLSLLLAAPLAAADEPPPPWMPSTPPPLTRSSVQHARELRREAKIFGAVGLALAGCGIAVGVVALDVPQGERVVRAPDGTAVTERVRDDANWFELAGGLALIATGFALVTFALYKVKQARRLDSE
jgi:hypothetical protein